MFLTQGLGKREAIEAIVKECHRRKLSIMCNMEVSFPTDRNMPMLTDKVDGKAVIRPRFPDGQVERCIFYGGRLL